MQYARWISLALPQIYKGIDNGKSVAELIDPKGPINASIEGFKASNINNIGDQINRRSAPPPNGPVEGEVRVQNGHRFTFSGGQWKYVPAAPSVPFSGG